VTLIVPPCRCRLLPSPGDQPCRPSEFARMRLSERVRGLGISCVRGRTRKLPGVTRLADLAPGHSSFVASRGSASTAAPSPVRRWRWRRSLVGPETRRGGVRRSQVPWLGSPPPARPRPLAARSPVIPARADPGRSHRHKRQVEVATLLAAILGRVGPSRGLPRTRRLSVSRAGVAAVTIDPHRLGLFPLLRRMRDDGARRSPWVSSHSLAMDWCWRRVRNRRPSPT